MNIHTHQINEIPMPTFAVGSNSYAVNDLVNLFHQASKDNSSNCSSSKSTQLEGFLEQLKNFQNNYHSFCRSAESYWNTFLKNIVAAIEKFMSMNTEENGSSVSNKNPLIKQLNRLYQQANMALLYIEV